jgi:hypothetical protein
MKNWYDIIPPHADIRKGHFNEAVFAADLGDVAAQAAPDDYRDPYLFYKKTYLTAGLENLLKRVHTKLTEGQGPSVVQIQTPFGGGKTHALVAIYHYLEHGPKVENLLPPGIDLLSADVSAIAGNHWNPIEGRTSDGLTRRTFWGEVAYQIGDRPGYETFRENDEARISPGKTKLREFLAAHQPCVLLFDEILEYVNRALDVREQLGVSLGTQTFSFFQELTEAVATLPHVMLVVTLPSSWLEDFGEQQEESLARMEKIFGRVEAIETPVHGEEVYAVVRRRLFEVENLKRADMREVIHRYFHLYQQHQDDLPPKAQDVNYRDKMEKAYPFHPDLIDILYEKWSTFPSFQRTRGVLRLLANVIEDLYQREVNLNMILPGDVNLDHPSVRREFLKHIGQEYEGVIGSDIAGHEAKAQALDADNKGWKHLAQRIATATFFHSFSADESEKGATLPYLKLATLHSDTMPAMVTEVLGKLANTLWYLNSRGDAYFFSRIPNLNRMILDKKELFSETYEERLKDVIEAEIGPSGTTGPPFTSYLWPESTSGRDLSAAIPDNRALKLIVLHPDDDGSRIPQWIERRGDGFREYKNTLFFALADTGAFVKLREDVKTVLALEAIKDEVDRGESPLPEERRDEIQRRMHKIQRDFSFNVRRMYHTLRFGEREIDLGAPTAGSETLSNWYWRELTSPEVGAIVEKLHYRMLVNKFIAANRQVSAAKVLDQFYKEPKLPVPASEDVVARAVQLGVQESALGIAEIRDDGIDPQTLRYVEDIPLLTVSFDEGVYLLSKERCEEIVARRAVEEEDKGVGEEGPGGVHVAVPQPPTELEVPTEPEKPQKPAERRYHHVRLVVADIPVSKIADVNRGVFMPLGQVTSDLTFRMEIEFDSEDGVSEPTLEQKVKETIRQIGARVVEETTE